MASLNAQQSLLQVVIAQASEYHANNLNKQIKNPKKIPATLPTS